MIKALDIGEDGAHVSADGFAKLKLRDDLVALSGSYSVEFHDGDAIECGGVFGFLSQDAVDVLCNTILMQLEVPLHSGGMLCLDVIIQSFHLDGVQPCGGLLSVYMVLAQSGEVKIVAAR
jgi:hypothetical protein